MKEFLSFFCIFACTLFLCCCGTKTDNEPQITAEPLPTISESPADEAIIVEKEPIASKASALPNAEEINATLQEIIRDAEAQLYDASVTSILDAGTADCIISKELTKTFNGQDNGKILVVLACQDESNSYGLLQANMINFIPLERLPQNLEEVGYVLEIHNWSETVGQFTDGTPGKQIYEQIILKQYYEGIGLVRYDSGILVGDEPAGTYYVSQEVNAIYGPAPDVTETLKDIKELLELK